MLDYMKRLILIAAMMCVVMQTAAQQSSRADRATRSMGEQAYLRTGCHACHGTVGHGGAGPNLAPDTLPLEAFRIWVRQGTPGWTIITGMPAFPPEVLTDDELAAVRAYLAGLPGPDDVEDIPLLRD